ncbi:initiation factor 2 [Thozetella sp. PMI_491]|nr:initiation factor 2 [Thozetella sp. PMI_491]
MIRGIIWQKRSASSVCAICRVKPQSLRPIPRRAYSVASEKTNPDQDGKQDGTRKTPYSTSGWGGGADSWGTWSQAQTSNWTPPASSESNSFNGLLPHERAAREQAMRNAPEASNHPAVSSAQKPASRPSDDGNPQHSGMHAGHDRKHRTPPLVRRVEMARGQTRNPSHNQHPHPYGRSGPRTPHHSHGANTAAPKWRDERYAPKKLSPAGTGQASDEWGQLRRRPREDSSATSDPLRTLSRGSKPSDPTGDTSSSQRFWEQARDRLGSSGPRPDGGHSRRLLGHDPARAGQAPRKNWGRSGGQINGSRDLSWNDAGGRPKTSEANTKEIPGREERDVAASPDLLDIPGPSLEALEYEDEGRRGVRERGDRHRERPERQKKVKGRPRERENQFESEEYGYDEDAAEERKRRKAARRAEKERAKLEALAAEAGPTPILLPEFISVSNLATALGVKQNQFVGELEGLGFEDISLESIMTGDTAALVAQEYGFEPKVDTGEGEDLKPRPPPEDPLVLPPRPPVVTIMGHVDHGKTTLLDYLRKSSVAATEHGGITQHIGAFSVQLSTGKQITFLDTPGHAAFLTMRQRGANVTDIVILVVAADDSVKPQTLEALKHAQSAKVPIIVAINKIDKDEARVEQVKADLSRHGVEIEDYGGDVQVVCVSGKTGQGMASLEENILTLSEILDMRAETDGMAEGWVLESSIKPIGRVATVLVKRGTLRQGDFIVAGKTWTRIRTLRNEAGLEIEEAPPGTPVEILGWREPPDAGDQVLQAPDEGRAKDAVHYRQEQAERGDAVTQMQQLEQARREREAAEAAAESAAAESTEEEQPGVKIVNFVVKGDVHGSVEAVCGSILEIGNHEVQPKVLRSSAGHLTEYDVEHAATSGSYIINFNNQIPGHIKRLAEAAGVKILDHTIIYHLAEDVKKTLSSYLTPTISTRVTGEAEVLQVFSINVKKRVYKNIAGCRVRNGAITSGGTTKYRVIRKGETIFEGPLERLMQGKKDATEIRKGAECGISLLGFEEYKEDDQIQAFEEIQEKRYL